MNIRSLLWKYSVITAGSAFFALSFNLFLTPNQIAPGGVSGIAVVIHYLTALPVGTTMLVLNIPLFILSYLKFGGTFIFSTLYATALGSAVIDLTSGLKPFTTDPILASVYGGVMLGAGVGLVFTFNATTGGSDIISRLIKLKFPHVRMGRLMLFVDVTIIAVSAVAFGSVNNALYAMITLYICTKVVDVIIYGMDYEKLAYIISDKSEEITKRIQTELERGVTLLMGEGGYSNQPKRIIMCALKRQEATRAAQIASDVDPDAFVIVVEAHEVLGDGFGKNIPGK